MYDHNSFLKWSLAEGITQYRFSRTDGWESAHPAGTAAHGVLSLMKDKGAFSVVEVQHAYTTLTGPPEGVATGLSIVQDFKGPFIVANGGFFIHLPRFFLDPADGMLMADEKLTHTVGPSSPTEQSGNFVPVPPAYADQLLRRTMTDDTFFHTGPSLGQELTIESPPFNLFSTRAGRFHYFVCDANGEKIESPVYDAQEAWDKQHQALTDEPPQEETTLSREVEEAWLTEAKKKFKMLSSGRLQYATAPPANKHIRTKWARVPGNLSHVSQANERSGVSRHENAWLFYAYTSERELGLTMNEFGSLVRGAIRMLGHTLATDNEVWANDGGPSIIQAFVDKDGNTKLLAQGGLDQQNPILSIVPETMRQIPNAIVAWPERFTDVSEYPESDDQEFFDAQDTAGPAET